MSGSGAVTQAAQAQPWNKENSMNLLPAVGAAGVSNPLKKRLSRLCAALPLAVVLCGAALPAHAGLVFTTKFDATVDAAAQTAILNGLSEYAPLFSDNVNVSLYFKSSGAGLGASSTFSFGVNYQTFYNALVADGSSAVDATALARLAVDGAGPNNPVNATRVISQGRAGLAALGISVNTTGLDTGAGDGLYYDGVIDLNLGIMNYSRSSIDANKYDLKAVMQHEVNEVLGSISNVTQSDPRPVDLFRFDASGNRVFTAAGDNAYFSIDGTTLLARYNQNSGGDYGDWWSASGAHAPQVQDAFSTPGATPDLGVEITLLDAIGWTRTASVNAVPEPGSMALVGIALLGGFVARRRRA
jgi:hypothetical protein